MENKKENNYHGWNLLMEGVQRYAKEVKQRLEKALRGK